MSGKPGTEGGSRAYRKAPPGDAEICVYCGANPATTRDHVVPRCLFPGKLPDNVLTVKACRRCNQSKSHGEDYLRDYLVADIRASRSPAAQAVFRGKMLASVRRGSSRLAKDFLSNGRTAPVVTRAGIFLGECVSAPVEAERITTVLTFMLKGLYYRILDKRLPDGCTVVVRTIDWLGIGPVWRALQDRPVYGYPGVFVCRFVYADEDNALTNWVFVFYDSVGVIIETDRADTGPSASLQPASLAGD